MNIAVRKANIADYSSIGNLIKNELGYSDIDLKKLYTRLAQMQSDKNYCTFVAVYDDQVVGFIGLCKSIAYEFDGEYMRIVALAVCNNYQHKGIGTKLIQQAEKYAAANNITAIGVNSGLKRLGAHAFYERSGYLKKSYSFRKYLSEPNV